MIELFWLLKWIQHTWKPYFWHQDDKNQLISYWVMAISILAVYGGLLRNMQIRSHGTFCQWQDFNPLIRYPREAKKIFLQYSFRVAWEPTSGGWLVASHSHRGGTDYGDCSYRAELRRYAKAMASTFYILLIFSAYRPHLMALNNFSDHIWHSDSSGSIGIDQQTFVFKISVDEKCCERR